MRTPIEKTALAVAAALLLLVAGIWLGGHPSDLPAFLRSGLVSGSQDASVDQALSLIEHDYFRRVAQSGLENGAIDGLIGSLRDPYASYDTPRQFRAFGKAPAPGTFGGIGVDVIVTRTGLLVRGVVAGSPAARGGLRRGDVIVAADGKSFSGRSAAYSTGVIRGRVGTPVTLRLRRGDRELTVTLRRAAIKQPAEPLVSGQLVTFRHVKVAVIALATFEVSGIHDEVARTLRRLLRRGAQAIVLDLRYNGGGLVREAQDVVSLFIRNAVVVTTRGRAQPSQTLRTTGRAIATTQPMAVLVNGDTASAAEIVTGALQVDHRAIVVGTHTYGKGVFQQVIQLPNGGAITITVGRYYLPNGRNLGAAGLRRGHGIEPNYVVTAPVTAHSDPAMLRALELLSARVR
ncbi:MAG TPA: S41 family peptidase [Solirubrobacteraceae bacterium]|nr:S41 family peptidase [Solirubrobacteraceae bacterium]